MRKYFQRKAFANMNEILPKGNPVPNSILIIFDSTVKEDEIIINQWLQQHKNIFSKKMLIGTEIRNISPKPLMFPKIGEKDITWFGSLKLAAINRVKHDFVPDILLVLHHESSKAIDFFAQAIPANLKISHRPAIKSAYNLILDSQANWSILLKEIDVLLPKVELVN